MDFELKRDWHYQGGPESEKVAKMPAGTRLGRIEMADGSQMSPQMLADAIVRGLAGEVRKQPKPSSPGRTKGKRSQVTDE